MITDITIGQYYPVGSILHRLDPRAKLVCTFIFIVSLFVQNSVSGYLAVTAFLGIVIAISKVPFRYMMKGLKPIIIIIFITFFFNFFFTGEGTLIIRFGIIKVTDKGLRSAVFMAVRIIYLIIGASLMTFTTTPNALTDGMEKLMRPLNKIGAPVQEVAMMMSIALRFIPILLEETDKIMKAQMARGADLENRNLIKKAKAMVPVLVPLFVSAFRRANDLAMAMEARCYRGGEGRTRMRPLKYQGRDFITYAIMLIYLAIVIVAGRYAPFNIWIF